MADWTLPTVGKQDGTDLLAIPPEWLIIVAGGTNLVAVGLIVAGALDQQVGFILLGGMLAMFALLLAFIAFVVQVIGLFATGIVEAQDDD